MHTVSGPTRCSGTCYRGRAALDCCGLWAWQGVTLYMKDSVSISDATGPPSVLQSTSDQARRTPEDFNAVSWLQLHVDQPAAAARTEQWCRPHS